MANEDFQRGVIRDALDVLEEIESIVANGEWEPGDHPVIDEVYAALRRYHETHAAKFAAEFG